MTSETHDPLKWPASYPVSSAGDAPLVAVVIPFILVAAGILGAIFVWLSVEWRRSNEPLVVSAASAETRPSPPASPPAADGYPTDMNTLGPEFGAWILKKHPEMQDQVEKLQQHLQTLCASINTICSRQDARFDPAGTCKSRPPQCAQ